MNLEEHKSEDLTPILHCCGTCVYWRRTDQYEGICTQGLSGNIDTTEIKFTCKRWAHAAMFTDVIDDDDD